MENVWIDSIKDKIRNARRRIFLSTLYIGKTEHEFINAIRDALKANPDLQVSILTDALRGCREAPNPSCASLLAALVAEFGSRVEIWMFHTPNLTGLRKKWIPQRINEGWGLQHMKLYGVDDEIIMSGCEIFVLELKDKTNGTSERIYLMTISRIDRIGTMPFPRRR
jgi:CDP-diacylglycerol---glycerol-3-phosphate 3-phosphatidyltransferase